MRLCCVFSLTHSREGIFILRFVVVVVVISFDNSHQKLPLSALFLDDKQNILEIDKIALSPW